MKLAAFAFEGHFLDHLAPVWLALPEFIRGDFYVDPSLVQRAAQKGISALPQPRPVHVKVAPRFDGPPALVASYGDIKEARRLGYGPFVFMEHGAGQSYPGKNGSYAGGPDRADNELILVPGEACAAIWRRAYPRARVAIVGCPKLDHLPERQGDGPPTVALSFHWPAPGQYAGTAIGTYSQVLQKVAQAFPTIGHAHPKGDWPRRIQKYYDRAGIPFVAEFEDVCRQADVYVCDNSSTIFEFAATGRPVVLLNARQWNRGRELGLRFWEAAHVGINVDAPHQLIPAIREALEDAPNRRADREDALARVYGVRTGGAAIAAKEIMDWLGAKELAVA